MAKLISKTPCSGLLPRTIGAVSFTEVDVGLITLVAPFAGQTKAVSNALKAAIGVSFPSPNRCLGTDVRVLWCGMGQALVMGAACPDVPAACVDHSDAWAIVAVDGGNAVDVLARLTPIDLRDGVFKKGHTARSLVGHMTGSITRTGAARYEVIVMRSMAETLVHDLTRAAEHLEARRSLPA